MVGESWLFTRGQALMQEEQKVWPKLNTSQKHRLAKRKKGEGIVGRFQEGNKDACVSYRSAASRKCPFVFFTLLLHFKWSRVNVSFQCSRFHRFHYTSCCHFNEASFFQRVWEQNLLNDLSEQTLSSSNVSLN